MKTARKLSLLAATLVTFATGGALAAPLNVNVPIDSGMVLDAIFAAQWTNEFTPTEVTGGASNGEVFIKGATYPSSWYYGEKSGNPGCRDNSTVKIKGAHTGNIVSIAVAAMLSGKKIKCQVQACEGSTAVGTQCKLVQ